MINSIHTKTGKVTIASILFSVVAIAFVFLIDIRHDGYIHRATADVATTSVTVINIPPSWTVLAVESPASTTTSPTNDGSDVTFQATGTDGNGEDYYLLICKNSNAPTPNAGAAPDCDAPTNQWAVSTSTASGAVATATYTASSSDAESEAWYAWICDANAGNPSCNGTFSGQESTADNKSPFNVNHRPTFTLFSDDSPTLPDGTTTWYATSSDPDSDGGADTVRLFVCKENDFTGTNCGPGGSWATSTFVTSNPSATGTPAAPIQDINHTAYGFIVDEHGLVASGGAQGTDSILTVANVAPTVSNVTVNSGTIVLTVEQGQSTGFAATLDVTDDNSCVANGSTTDEILASDINVYRSGIGSSSCQVSGTDYDPNHCYTGDLATTTWNVSCTQNAGTCTGPDDDTVTWTCTYELWYVADPTDTGVEASPFAAENWLATAFATDDNSATSSLVEAGSCVELQQFLQFDVGTTSIAYGSFQPGQGNASTSRPTTIFATGNVALDENLSGTDMCPDTVYPGCSGQSTSTIFAPNQEFATSTFAYGSAFTTDLATTTQELEINLNKTTSTTTPNSTITYWGIQVPVAITLSGDYIGVNTIEGKVAETIDW